MWISQQAFILNTLSLIFSRSWAFKDEKNVTFDFETYTQVLEKGM